MKKNIIPILILVLFVVVATVNYLHAKKEITTPVPTTTAPSETQQSEKIIYPAGGEKLVKGQTYTLSWTGGDPGETQIFLIDTALESAGVSVSISDRVYHIQNTGSYQYTVPKRLPDGVYKFEIGDQTSNTFQIVSK